MNQLTVRQRKAVYATLLVLLLVGLIILGAPAGRKVAGQSTGMQSFLAASREKHDLGEASLGDVDPTSATMNLVLLGMRGVAASVLWNQAEEYKKRKNFTELEQTVESIILLQPHFKSVWRFQAWNLAFNVSAECDAVADRFFWVKRGAKFLKRGVDRNQMVPDLKFDMGRFLGEKIGNSDEKETFREFFMRDPDELRWKGGPDEDINPPPAQDNYLVARDWYFKANETLEHKGVRQSIMDISLFLAYPYRSLMDLGRAMHREGIKGDIAALSDEQRLEAYENWAQTLQNTWSQALDEWVNQYGRQEIQTTGGGLIVLENDEGGLADLARFAEQDNMTIEEKLRWQDQYHKITGYTFWRRHCEIERRPEMTEARYLLAEGRRLYRDVQDLEASRQFLEQGMAKLENVVQSYQVNATDNVLIDDEEEIVEDAMKAILVWQQVLLLLDEPIPETFPLQTLWNHPSRQPLREELTEKFRRWAGVAN